MESLVLKNCLKSVRGEKKMSQGELAEMVGVSRQTISSIENNQFCPSAKLALLICVALEKSFEELFILNNERNMQKCRKLYLLNTAKWL